MFAGAVVQGMGATASAISVHRARQAA